MFAIISLLKVLYPVQCRPRTSVSLCVWITQSHLCVCVCVCINERKIHMHTSVELHYASCFFISSTRKLYNGR